MNQVSDAEVPSWQSFEKLKSAGEFLQLFVLDVVPDCVNCGDDE